MSNKLVVILNGPPASGKDIAAHHLQRIGLATKKEFKHRLISITKAVYCLTDAQWEHLYTRENKEVKTPLLMGLSPREALIFVSEQIIKPAYGDDFFGIAAAQTLVEGINVFSDGGFVPEVKALVGAVGYDNVLVIRMMREGCSFDNDSRSYLPDDLCRCVVDFSNNGSLNELLNGINHVVSDWKKVVDIMNSSS
jgi:hypothetical protein